MSKRINASEVLPEVHHALLQLHHKVEKAVSDTGLEQRLIELVKIRVSQINGCAFCTDLHTRDARKLGETERRIFLLPTWWETDLYSEQERAALKLAEAMARLPEHQDVPDAVYSAATEVLTEEQYAVVVWAATVINAFNRLAVTGRKSLPPEGS